MEQSQTDGLRSWNPPKIKVKGIQKENWRVKGITEADGLFATDSVLRSALRIQVVKFHSNLPPRCFLSMGNVSMNCFMAIFSIFIAAYVHP